MKLPFLGIIVATALLLVACDTETPYQKMIENEYNKTLLTSQEEEAPEWNLVWEQNFDLVGIAEASSSFDAAYWDKCKRGSSDWNVHMSSFDSCYAFRDGNLILRGIKNTTQVNDPSKYLTGGYTTQGKKNFGLGRLEVRAKLQGRQGAWPAIWMMPNTTLSWPLGGEIDIMERINRDKKVQQTVHTHYTKNLGFTDNPINLNVFYDVSPDKYNSYAVERYQDSLVFYINHHKTFVYRRVKDLEADMRQFPFADHDFYLILSMQLGGSWAGNVEDADLPNEMHIDYVRFYELKKEEE